MGNFPSSPFDPIAAKTKELVNGVIVDPISSKTKQVLNGVIVDPISSKTKEVLKDVITDPKVVAAAKDMSADVVEQMKLAREQAIFLGEQMIEEMKKVQQNARNASLCMEILSGAGVMAASVYLLSGYAVSRMKFR